MRKAKYLSRAAKLLYFDFANAGYKAKLGSAEAKRSRQNAKVFSYFFSLICFCNLFANANVFQVFRKKARLTLFNLKKSDN